MFYARERKERVELRENIVANTVHFAAGDGLLRADGLLRGPAGAVDLGVAARGTHLAHGSSRGCAAISRAASEAGEATSGAGTGGSGCVSAAWLVVAEARRPWAGAWSRQVCHGGGGSAGAWGAGSWPAAPISVWWRLLRLPGVTGWLYVSPAVPVATCGDERAERA